MFTSIRRTGRKTAASSLPSPRGGRRPNRPALLGLERCEDRVLMANAALLGAAESFAILGATTVTNTGPSLVFGDLGVSPGTAVTGFPPGVVTGGTIHAGDAAATQAHADLATAYGVIAGEASTATLAGDLTGLTLTPGRGTLAEGSNPRRPSRYGAWVRSGCRSPGCDVGSSVRPNRRPIRKDRPHEPTPPFDSRRLDGLETRVSPAGGARAPRRSATSTRPRACSAPRLRTSGSP